MAIQDARSASTGHSTTRRPGSGAAIGRVYRDQSEMAARVVTALEQRLEVVLHAARRTRAEE